MKCVLFANNNTTTKLFANDIDCKNYRLWHGNTDIVFLKFSVKNS